MIHFAVPFSILAFDSLRKALYGFFRVAQIQHRHDEDIRSASFFYLSFDRAKARTLTKTAPEILLQDQNILIPSVAVQYQLIAEVCLNDLNKFLIIITAWERWKVWCQKRRDYETSKNIERKAFLGNVRLSLTTAYSTTAFGLWVVLETNLSSSKQAVESVRLVCMLARRSSVCFFYAGYWFHPPSFIVSLFTDAPCSFVVNYWQPAFAVVLTVLRFVISMLLVYRHWLTSSTFSFGSQANFWKSFRPGGYWWPAAVLEK